MGPSETTEAKKGRTVSLSCRVVRGTNASAQIDCANERASGAAPAAAC